MKLSITLKPDCLIEWCGRGRQEVEEGANLRQVACGRCDDRFTLSGWRAFQFLADAELSIPPALQREKEERAVRAIDIAWATFAKARQVKWSTNRSA